MNYLESINLTIGYKSRLAGPLNFTIGPGEILHITGPNGSGKSTLLKTLLGHLPLRSGSISWKVSSEEISYLPQLSISSHNFNFTLGEILDVYAIEEEIKHYLRKDISNQLWINSSGGERQIALILTRITKKTKVIVLDEPLNHLDLDSRKIIENLISSLMKKRSELSIIIVSHLEMNLAKRELNL